MSLPPRKCEIFPFPQLPPEIRRSIWKACLPVRVIEFDDTGEPDYGTYCNSLLTSSINARPPIITRVCQESRRVAFENGYFFKWDVDRPDLRNGMEDPYAWCTVLKDGNWISTVPGTIWSLHWDPDIHGHIAGFYEGDPVELFFWVVSRAEAASTVSIKPGHVGKFGPTYEASSRYWSSAGLKIFALLETQDELLTTMLWVNIHAGIEDALESELFGISLEERVKLIDAFDQNAIQNYYHFWSHCSPKEDTEPKIFFDFAVTKTLTFYEKIRDWKSQVEDEWINSRFRIARKNGFPGIDESYLFGIYLDLKTSQPVPLDASGTVAPLRRVNRKHPWVLKTLQEMPRFKPMIEFRFCENECYNNSQKLNSLRASRKSLREEIKEGEYTPFLNHLLSTGYWPGNPSTLRLKPERDYTTLPWMELYDDV